MTLDFTPLGNAINQLEKSLKYATSDAAKADPGLFEQLRTSVIHCFEFTYELSHKMLKRYLEETTANPEEFDLSTFQNLIRTGNERNMLRSDWCAGKTIVKHAPAVVTPMTKKKPNSFMPLPRTFSKKRAT